jgi:hypothetical protein
MLPKEQISMPQRSGAYRRYQLQLGQLVPEECARTVPTRGHWSHLEQSTSISTFSIPRLSGGSFSTSRACRLRLGRGVCGSAALAARPALGFSARPGTTAEPAGPLLRRGQVRNPFVRSPRAGLTIGPKIRISRPDDGSARCNVSRARAPPRSTSQLTPPLTTLSTSNAISIAPRGTRRGDDHVARGRRGRLKFRTAIPLRVVVSIT